MYTTDTSQMGEYTLNELTDMHLLYPHTEPVRKTGDLRFKSQLRHKFFSQYLSSIRISTYKIFNIDVI